jgi:hypothetical protein
MMQKIPINGLTLFFEAEDSDSVDLVRGACEKSMSLMQQQWGLVTPKDCRVYIMTSWLGFVFRSAPWRWKIILAITITLWAYRARKIWPLAGGWELRHGRRRVVGVKPPRLLQLADRRMGDRIFIKEQNVGEKVQSITCHELTHAFTSHLRLPTWLKEGLAMVMVDMFFERPTVKTETLQLLGRSSGKPSLGGRQKLRVEDENAMVTLYARGYWITRYIEETRPGALKELLARRHEHDELESKIAGDYGKGLEEFWEEIDGELLSHFKHSPAGVSESVHPQSD